MPGAAGRRRSLGKRADPGLSGPHRRGRRQGPVLPVGRRARSHGGRRGCGRQTPGGAFALGGRAHRSQGHLLRQRHGDHLCLADPQRLHPPIRRHDHRQVAGRRPDLPGQAQHGRVRDGQLHRELRFQDHAEPLGPWPGAGRLQRRLRRLRRRRRGPLGPRHRYRRFHPAAGLAVRGGGPQAHLRSRESLRPDSVRQLARSDRPPHTRRERRGRPARSHRRARSSGFHQHRPSGAGRRARPGGSGGSAFRGHQGVRGRSLQIPGSARCSTPPWIRSGSWEACAKR